MNIDSLREWENRLASNVYYLEMLRDIVGDIMIEDQEADGELNITLSELIEDIDDIRDEIDLAIEDEEEFEDEDDLCPLYGDAESNCLDCVYSGDYMFKDGECIRRPQEEK